MDSKAKSTDRYHANIQYAPASNKTGASSRGTKSSSPMNQSFLYKKVLLVVVLFLFMVLLLFTCTGLLYLQTSEAQFWHKQLKVLKYFNYGADEIEPPDYDVYQGKPTKDLTNEIPDIEVFTDNEDTGPEKYSFALMPTEKPNVQLLRNMRVKRQKRQVDSGSFDCAARKDECQLILQGFNDVTKDALDKIKHLQKTLVQHNFVTENDPKNLMFRRVMECLRCRAAQAQESHVYTEAPHGAVGRQLDGNSDMVPELEYMRPFLENMPYADINDNVIDGQNNRHYDEDAERIAKAPVVGAKQVIETVRNSTTTIDGRKVWNIVKNTTVVEDDANQETTMKPATAFRSGGRGDESHVTRNIDQTPIILPTAETMKTSQQIQFTPQSSWPSIPMCFYVPPSAANSYPFKPPSGNGGAGPGGNGNNNPGSPFFSPYNMPQQGLPNQQKFFPMGNQPGYPPMHPMQMQMQMPMAMPMPMPMAMSMMGSPMMGFPPMQPPNMPYYCTYMPMPPNFQTPQPQLQPQTQPQPQPQPQLQPQPPQFPSNYFPYMQPPPNMNDYPYNFMAKSAEGNVMSTTELPDANRVAAVQRNNQFDTPDDKQWPDGLPKKNCTQSMDQQVQERLLQSTECDGFTCPPPYAQCIRHDQRCDGRVDCFGAEDELDCQPELYYARAAQAFPNWYQMSEQQRKVAAATHTATIQAINEQATKFYEQWRNQMSANQYTQGWTLPFDQSAGQGSIANQPQQQPGQVDGSPPLTTPVPVQLATMSVNEPTSTIYVSPTQDFSTTRLVSPVPSAAPPTTAKYDESEQTTYPISLQETPQLFHCKRITQTIPLEKRCDNEYDCEDISDEQNCTCKEYLRNTNPSAICDGHVDCHDGTDEENCGICKDDEYHCHRSGTCIPAYRKCDQIMDCKLNEDELDCFTLTDGNHVNLDMDKRPHLNMEGVVTSYGNGEWQPTCFRQQFLGNDKRREAGEKFCEYLGFKSVEETLETTVRKAPLRLRQSGKNTTIGYEYPPRLHAIQKRDTNDTCTGLQIRCKPILDKKLTVHLKINQRTGERTFLWPWEALIFVEGRYACSAVILDEHWILANTACHEGLDVNQNYTTAVMGSSSPSLLMSSPYQQVTRIIETRPVEKSDAILLRLENKVNMTRYVQPLYLEKRIFPAALNDTCVAIGVNAKKERKIQFLETVADNCPKCQRCYIEKKTSSNCDQQNQSNATQAWNGNVVCQSGKGGWYPAAVFRDMDENCGFSGKQILNSIDYVHAHLSEAIDDTAKPTKKFQCEGLRCNFGKCLPFASICDGIRDCPDGADEEPIRCKQLRRDCGTGYKQKECKCDKSEMTCGNGSCVPKEKFCDGVKDCADGTDEPRNCTCGEYLKVTEPKRLCDGRRHCLDKTDESPALCRCKESSFKCSRSILNGAIPCVPQDFVCDGERDCPQGEDERDEMCYVIKRERNDPPGTGEVLRYTYGVKHTECLPEPVQSQQNVTGVCKRMGYTSGIQTESYKPTESQYVPRNDYYMFTLNPHSYVVMRDDKSLGVWKKPETPCYRLFVHCL